MEIATGPADELIELEDDADLEMLAQKVASSLPDRRREVLGLYSAGYKRPQIADRLGVPERVIKRDLLEIMEKARAILARLAGGGRFGEPLVTSLSSAPRLRTRLRRLASTSRIAAGARRSPSGCSRGGRRPARCFRPRSPKAQAPAW